MDAKNGRGKAWLIVALLFVFMVINFADKVVIGVAAVPLMRDLGISPSEFGRVVSSFFLLFSLSAILVGFLANRVQAKWVLAGLAVVWSLALLPLAGQVTVGMLFASRIALGAGEGPSSPVAVHAVYKWFSNESRLVPATLMNTCGGFAGVLAGAPALAWVVQHYSWHAAFGALGVIGLIWTAAWLVLGEDGPVKDAALAAEPRAEEWPLIPYAKLLLSRTFVGTACCGFAAYWGTTLQVSWMPAFLSKGLGYDLQIAAWLVSLTTAISLPVVLLASWWSERLVKAGVPSRRARGLLVSACVLVSGVFLIAMTMLAAGPAEVVCLVVALALGTCVYAPAFATVGEIVPTRQRGAALAIYSAVITAAGLIAPTVMGYAVEWGGALLQGYLNGFLVSAAVAVFAGVVGVLAIDPEGDRARLLGTRPLVHAQPAAATGA